MSDVTPPSDRVCDLVLAGGDVKAAALVGAVLTLREAGYTVNRVAGTSSGSVIAALVAADVASEDLLTMVLDLDFEKVADFRPLARQLPWRLGWVPSLLRHGSVCRGDYLADWLSGHLGPRGIVGFDDLRPPLPLPESPAPTGRDRLVVVAADVSSGRLRRLPQDLGVYGPGVDLDVVTAVRASSAVPFLFPPVRVLSRSGAHLLVDGGVASTVPIETFDAPPERAPRWPTIGISLSTATAPASQVYRTDGILRFGSAILSTMRGFYDRLSLDTPAVRQRVIGVPVDDIPRLQFTISRDIKLDLVDRGRRAAADFLDGWSESVHLARRAAQAAAYRSAAP